MRTKVHTKAKELQYKILNRYIATNCFLKKIGVIESEQCTFCKNEIETLKHLFYECRVVANFWQIFHLWWERCTSENFSLTFKDIIIGYRFHNPPILLNLCILYAKFFIYTCRVQGRHPAFSNYLLYLSVQFDIERCVAHRDKLPALEIRWSKINLIPSAVNYNKNH